MVCFQVDSPWFDLEEGNFFVEERQTWDRWDEKRPLNKVGPLCGHTRYERTITIELKKLGK